MPNLTSETEILKSMILDENMKFPNKSGITPLLEKAKINSRLSPLSPKKNFEEEVVCNLVQYFNKFTQINFTELESYIVVSSFSNGKIIDEFAKFIRNEELDEDIVMKACVCRFIQHLNRSFFPLGYLRKRFNELSRLDPWLLAELVIASNWKEGVEMIKELLISNPDTSYLFSLLPAWMKDDNTEAISYALNQWYDLLGSADKDIVKYYAQNYGYSVDSLQDRDNGRNPEAVKDILEAGPFREFSRKRIMPANFETLQS
ncbi:MAG: hypothetical protein JST75_02485 [Bacteroidetes bacterium]|nr:hypothetical protein [Bacteroidota bacterium]